MRRPPLDAYHTFDEQLDFFRARLFAICDAHDFSFLLLRVPMPLLFRAPLCERLRDDAFH